MALKPVEAADRYGVVEVDDAGRIVKFREKTPGSSGTINAGCYLLDRGVLADVHLPVPPFSLERDFFEAYVDQLHLQGCVQDKYFVDIGVPEDYRAAQKRLGGGTGGG